VLDEAADGDFTVARRRLEALKGIPTLPLDAAILDVAEEKVRVVTLGCHFSRSCHAHS
jgi:hypothetical protein